MQVPPAALIRRRHVSCLWVAGAHAMASTTQPVCHRDSRASRPRRTRQRDRKSSPVVYHARNQLSTAIEMGEYLLGVAERAGDASLLVSATLSAGCPLLWQGKFTECLARMEQCIALYDRDAHRSLALCRERDAVRTGLRLVHRRRRHARSSGCARTPRRADVSGAAGHRRSPVTRKRVAARGIEPPP